MRNLSAGGKRYIKGRRVRSSWAALGVCGAAVAITLLGAATATAQAATTLGAQRSMLSSFAPLDSSFGALTPFLAPIAGSAPPLIYEGGPVMGTTSAGTTLHPLYWAPSGYAFQSGYQPAMDGFFQDVAAGSGSTSNVYGVATQYYQLVGGAAQYIRYAISAAGELDDSDAYAASGCTPDGGADFTVCLTNEQIAAEVSAYTAAQSLSAGLADEYVVFFPPGVETCFSNLDSAQGGECSSEDAGGYCAYHDHAGTAAEPLIYAAVPYVTYCSGSPPPSGAVAVEEDATVVAHETIEAMTDPLANAWGDSNGNELADMCVGEITNQDFGSAQWSIQDVFSNVDYADGGGGCTNSLGTPPPAPAITSVTPQSSADSGGTSVTLVGTNLGVVSSVEFGTTLIYQIARPASNEISVVSPPGAPGTVVDLRVITPGGMSPTSPADQFGWLANPPDAPAFVEATAGNKQVNVGWGAPIDDGGAAVSGYDVEYSTDGGATWNPTSIAFHTSPATSQLITGLSDGVAYSFRVAAINSAGLGPYAGPSTAVTPQEPFVRHIVAVRCVSVLGKALRSAQSFELASVRRQRASGARGGCTLVIHHGVRPQRLSLRKNIKKGYVVREIVTSQRFNAAHSTDTIRTSWEEVKRS